MDNIASRLVFVHGLDFVYWLVSRPVLLDKVQRGVDGGKLMSLLVVELTGKLVEQGGLVRQGTLLTMC